MTSPEQSADAGPLDQLPDGAAGERAIPGHGSLAGFAAQLRELRERAGRPSYRRLAQLAHYSHTALSQAAAGHSLPSLAVTQAFVRACGGDVAEWTARWHEVGQSAQLPGEPPSPTVRRPPTTDSRWQAPPGGLRAKGRIAAAGMAAAACVTAMVLWTAGPATMSSRPGSARPLLQVESSGLYVRYAVVTNSGTRAGYAYVLNVGAGRVHRSPRPVPPGQSWTYFFDRDLKDGAQICGSVDLGPAACAGVHAGSQP